MTVKVEEYQEINLRKGSLIVSKMLNYIETKNKYENNKLINIEETQFQIKFDDVRNNAEICQFWNSKHWTKEQKEMIVNYYLSANK